MLDVPFRSARVEKYDRALNTVAAGLTALEAGCDKPGPEGGPSGEAGHD